MRKLFHIFSSFALVIGLFAVHTNSLVLTHQPECPKELLR